MYSLKDGINDGFLTPFRVKQISTTLDEYVYTPDDRLIEGQVEAGKRYTESDFNRIIEIKEREQKRIEIFMLQIDQREKTLVFCATQDHALAIRDLVNQLKVGIDPNYCHRVTADDGALRQDKLNPLLRLRYRDSLADAVDDLGKPEEIKQVFTGFQRFLYADSAA